MQQDFDEYDDTITEELPVPELAELTPEEEDDLRDIGDTMFSSPASSIAELYDQLEYEELEQLDGGSSAAAAQEVTTALMRPSGPRMAKRTYGDFGRTKTRDGVVDLPAPVDSVIRISCHGLIAAELRKLVRAWYYGVIYGEKEKPIYDEAESLWHLLRSIKGAEQKLRTFVPARFGDKRISPTSWGLAITVNRTYNREQTMMRNYPSGDPLSLTSEGKPGYMFYDGHPIVQIAETLGWAWLGRPTYPNGTTNAYPDPAVFAWIRGWE